MKQSPVAALALVAFLSNGCANNAANKVTFAAGATALTFAVIAHATHEAPMPSPDSYTIDLEPAGYTIIGIAGLIMVLVGGVGWIAHSQNEAAAKRKAAERDAKRAQEAPVPDPQTILDGAATRAIMAARANDCATAEGIVAKLRVVDAAYAADLVRRDLALADCLDTHMPQ